MAGISNKKEPNAPNAQAHPKQGELTIRGILGWLGVRIKRENLRVANLNQVGLVFGTEGLNQLDVLQLVTGLDEDTQMSLALVESPGGFTETTGETIVNETSL
jgi:hypothetical protein